MTTGSQGSLKMWWPALISQYKPTVATSLRSEQFPLQSRKNLGRRTQLGFSMSQSHEATTPGLPRRQADPHSRAWPTWKRLRPPVSQPPHFQHIKPQRDSLYVSSSPKLGFLKPFQLWRAGLWSKSKKAPSSLTRPRQHGRVGSIGFQPWGWNFLPPALLLASKVTLHGPLCLSSQLMWKMRVLD